MTLLGRRNDIYKLMSMADVMILPSFSEGLPTVAVEAQAMGLYSLISDTVTTECDLGLGLVRYLPIGDADLWADAIVRRPQIPMPDQETILQKLDGRAFTSEGAFRCYLGTLERKMNEK